MIPDSTLYDEYIDRQKLSEKNPFEYIVPPPLKRGWNNKLRYYAAPFMPIRTHFLNSYEIQSYCFTASKYSKVTAHTIY